MKNISALSTAAAAAFLAGCSSPCERPSGGGENWACGDNVATFDVKHDLTIKVPAGAKSLRAWFTMPQNEDADQRIANFKVAAPGSWRFTTDDQGNTYIFMDVSNPTAGSLAIATSFEVRRREVRLEPDAAKSRPYTDFDLAGKDKYLQPSSQVIINDDIRAKAKEIVGSDKNPVSASRKIYDYVLNAVQYWVKEPAKLKASGKGSTEYAMTQCTGNCTDFHALYASLSRAAGIPTRVPFGSFFKGPLNAQDKDQSYHCWVEFYDPVYGWVPLDVAVADLFVDDYKVTDENREKVTLTLADGFPGYEKGLIDYYFGNIDNRRVVWNTGRDVNLEPRQNGGSINMLPKAYVEIDGKALAEGAEGWTRKLTFTERK